MTQWSQGCYLHLQVQLSDLLKTLQEEVVSGIHCFEYKSRGLCMTTFQAPDRQMWKIKECVIKCQVIEPKNTAGRK